MSSEVRWSDQQVRAEEKRQTEKSDEEKRNSKAAFEQRLNQDRTTRQEMHKAAQTQAHEKTAQSEKAQNEGTRSEAEQQTKGQKASGKSAKDAARKENAVLAHVRGQAAQQAKQQGPILKRPAVDGQESAALQHDMERVASSNQEGRSELHRKGDESVGTTRTLEKSRGKDLDETDKVKDKDTQETKAESQQETKAAQNQQQVGMQNQQIDPDQQRRNKEQQGQGGQQGQQGQQQGQVAQSDAAKGPSAQAIKRANKAQEIQKLCEKLLDNFYLGAAPDGSAMMRMELKEGVLQGLVIDLKVDDKRRVKLTLSGGNKEAIDFVTSSRGELARALGRKGLVLEEVNAG